MKKQPGTVKSFLVSCLVVMWAATQSDAVIIHDTTGGAVFQGLLVGKATPASSNINQPADGFVVAGGDFQLNTVTVNLARGFGDGDAVVRFWADSGGNLPGALLESWTIPGDTVDPPFNWVEVTLSSLSTPLLSAGETFWVSAAMSDDNTGGSGQLTNIAPNAAAFAFSNSENATWLSVTRSMALSMSIDATAVVGPLLGDANNDSLVSGLDLIAAQQNFGTDYSNGVCDGLGLGDANDDCLVTGLDLISVQQNFGMAIAAAVPEPVTLAVWVAGLLWARQR